MWKCVSDVFAFQVVGMTRATKVFILFLFFPLYIHDDAWIIKNWTGKKKTSQKLMLRQGTPTHTLPDDDPFTGINGLPKSWLAAMKISRNQPGIGLAF